MITVIELMREHGEPMTVREIAAEFSKINDLRIMYDDLAGTLQHHKDNGSIKRVVVHKKDWREDKWQIRT